MWTAVYGYRDAIIIHEGVLGDAFWQERRVATRLETSLALIEEDCLLVITIIC